VDSRIFEQLNRAELRMTIRGWWASAFEVAPVARQALAREIERLIVPVMRSVGNYETNTYRVELVRVWRRMPLSVLQAAMEMVMRALAAFPVEQWGGWVTYLLEALEADGGASEEEFRQVLEGVREGITTRLDQGLW